MTDRPTELPPQSQTHQPGREAPMTPPPQEQGAHYRSAGKLTGKVALITGGDSGIGRAVAVHFAKEGAEVAIAFLEEDEDAQATRRLVEEEGCRCLTLRGDAGERQTCQNWMDAVMREFGQLDILVNNAGEQHTVDDFRKISEDQLKRTFATNVFSAFYLIQAALHHMQEGSAIINTASVTAYRGHKSLLDYSATKGAIVALTRSLALHLADRKIRVNGVAPGPIWTPLIPGTFSSEHVERFGQDTALGRPGQPDEVAPCYVFLASADSSYMTGQMLHPNGGDIING